MRHKIAAGSLIALLLGCFVVLYGCNDGDTGFVHVPPGMNLNAPASQAFAGGGAAAPMAFIGRNGQVIPQDCGSSVSCAVFQCRQQAQAYFLATGCAKLDNNKNGQACETVPDELRAQGVTQRAWDTPCL